MRRLWEYALPLVLLILLVGTSTAYGTAYRGYTYDLWERPVNAPQAYLPVEKVDGDRIGVGAFRNPRDLFVAADDRIYIADSGNNRIVVLDRDWDLVQVIDSFQRADEQDTFRNPQGLYVTPANELYVADTNNGRIIVLTHTGEFIREIGAPTSHVEGVIPDGFDFQPFKLVVDRAGRIYAIVQNVYDGILEFGVDGQFRGFIGAPRIAPNIIDYLWRRIATGAQRESMMTFLPTEYSNIALDEYGFIYATVAEGEVQRKEFVRRLNPTGTDVLRRRGFHPPIGDIIYPNSWEDVAITGPSALTAIVPQKHGVYSVLDRRRGRVFTYDAEGHLLYAFGGSGDQLGLFRNAVALDMLEGEFLVLDSMAGSFTVFEPTVYSAAILKAIESHHTGFYEESAEVWEKVSQMNSNFDLAYTGVGGSLLRQDRYKEAMAAFQLANNRLDYSEALGLYRREILANNFGLIMGIIGLVLAAIWLRSRYKKRQGAGPAMAPIKIRPDYSQEKQPIRFFKELGNSLRYALYLVVHPFDAFWDLKHEKRGSVPAATVILTAVTLTYVFVRQYTGFVFNARNLKELNVLTEAVSILLPFGLWCSVNWALTTLMEGKGTFRDVYIASAYALTPLVLINVPATVLSHFLTVQEGAFYYFLVITGVVWTGGLLFFGTMVTHDYDGRKTVLTSLAVIVGIVIVLFLGLLLFTLVDQLISFVRDIYTELVFRL